MLRHPMTPKNRFLASFTQIFLCFLLSSVLISCGASQKSDTSPSTQSPNSNQVGSAADRANAVLSDSGPIYLSVSDKIPEKTALLLQQRFSAVTASEVEFLGSDVVYSSIDGAATIIYIGEREASTGAPAVASVTRNEEILVQSFQINDKQIYIADGFNNADDPLESLRADLFAAYTLLEALGYRFLHPLEPSLIESEYRFKALNLQESPRWPIRAWHIHTQHPLELTHVLNGWGTNGPDDKAGWMALLGEWQLFLEWAIANKQNRVEWFLLRAESWGEFADSEERQSRLRTLVDMAHAWGLEVGIDAPIAFKQQHAWTMLRSFGNEIAQIQKAVDWLNTAGFDFFEIEMGFSEFTHPSDHQMLEWMNEVARYSDERYGKPTYVKVHCTQNQVAKNFVDPETGEALNFNFLPYYADSRLGVLPHTVQFYDLEGHAPTYDNENFQFMRRYMQLEAGRREVLYYPETAYWVSFDIDVPLFLPVYLDRRLFDLRLIASDEDAGLMGRGEHAGSRIQGQVNFSSGWEWGYWMNDVVTARAAWDPKMNISDHKEALTASLEPVTSLFGELQDDVTRSLLEWIKLQNELMIDGVLNGSAPDEIKLRNAQAYLQGWETWDEVGKLTGQLETQPNKMGLLDMINPFANKKHKVDYESELQPLLSETAIRYRVAFERFKALEASIPTYAAKIFNELRDSMEITALRAEQVLNLYETMANVHPIILNADKTKANVHLNQARQALDKASLIVAERELNYRSNADRIAGWEYNPTAYHFGYLWTVRSLHYWWRDEGKVVDRPVSPGYMNILDPVDIANGEGVWRESLINLSWLRNWLSSLLNEGNLVEEILYEPANEPLYPQDNLRDRPRWYQPID